LSNVESSSFFVHFISTPCFVTTLSKPPLLIPLCSLFLSAGQSVWWRPLPLDFTPDYRPPGAPSAAGAGPRRGNPRSPPQRKQQRPLPRDGYRGRRNRRRRLRDVSDQNAAAAAARPQSALAWVPPVPPLAGAATASASATATEGAAAGSAHVGPAEVARTLAAARPWLVKVSNAPAPAPFGGLGNGSLASAWLAWAHRDRGSCGWDDDGGGKGDKSSDTGGAPTEYTATLPSRVNASTWWALVVPGARKAEAPRAGKATFVLVHVPKVHNPPKTKTHANTPRGTRTQRAALSCISKGPSGEGVHHESASLWAHRLTHPRKSADWGTWNFKRPLCAYKMTARLPWPAGHDGVRLVGPRCQSCSTDSRWSGRPSAGGATCNFKL